MANNSINVTSDTVIKLLIRRGLDADRKTIILFSGELGYAIDTKRVFVGDGVTTGGNLVGNLNFGIVQGIENYVPIAYTGDTIFQNIATDGSLDNTLYVFSNGGWRDINPVLGAPFDYSTGKLLFNPTYLSLDPVKSILNVNGGITSNTLNSGTMSTSMITIQNEPVYNTDGVNLYALLSGIQTAEAYARNFSNGFYVPLSGRATVRGTLSSTTLISVSTLPFNGYDLTNKNYVDQSIYNAIGSSKNFTANGFLPLSGGVLTANNLNTPSSVTLTPTDETQPTVSINQYGTGSALSIQDTNYNLNPFIVDSFGTVGCGGVPQAGGTQDGVARLNVFGPLSASSDTVINGGLYINNNNYAAIELGNNINGYGFSVTKESTDNSFNIWTNVLGSGNSVNRFKIYQSGTIAMAFNGGQVGIGSDTGIGTRTPGYRLDVQGGNISFQNAPNTNNEVDVFLGPQSVGVAGYIYGTNSSMGFYSGAAGQQVSIGKTTSNPNVAINTGTGSNASFSVAANGINNVIYANGAGRVGIGTATPSATLDVEGNTYINGTLTTTGAINSQGDITAFYTSDERLKNNIKPITSALDKIELISGVEYDWNTDLQDNHVGHDVGVIAQEIESVLPEAVTTRKDGYKAVNYDKVIPLLLQAIKELKAEVQSLKK